MKIDILTLFPNMFDNIINESIIKRALDKKSVELREAQIQKGSEAVVASENTLAGVKTLIERYDQAYYDYSKNQFPSMSLFYSPHLEF